MSNSDWIKGVCLLKNTWWKIEGDNLILMSQKENVHDNDI